jgi:DNA methylase
MYTSALTQSLMLLPGEMPMQTAKASGNTKADVNKLLWEDRAAHDWYRFVLSFPPHLVRTYLQRFHIGEKQVVLDPFCGTGTTLVECKKLAIASIGIEANPMAHFASQVKTDWTPDPGGLIDHAERIGREVRTVLGKQNIQDDPLPSSERTSARRTGSGV